MSLLQALVLGAVQGLTEFLPVSSSGHLLLVPWALGWPDQGLAFDAAIHLGTLAALVAYFHRDLAAIAATPTGRRLGAVLLVATVPAGLAGLLLGGVVERHLRSPLVVAVATAFWGIVMAVADRCAARQSSRQLGDLTGRQRGDLAGPSEPLERISWARGAAVGVAQALALVPGTSRSGITLTAGLALGLDRPSAARYSFLLGLPITAAAGSAKALEVVRAGGLDAASPLALAVATLAAAVTGWLAVAFLLRYLTRGSLLPFAAYRLVLAAAVAWHGLAP